MCHELTHHEPNEKGTFMAHVTIFGNGNMGTAIDELLTAEGTTVAHQEGGSAYNHRSGCRR
jgi:hypothetical protein